MPTQSPTTDITPIKTNLFRFLNITNPSLTKRDNKSILVNGPTSTSHFRDGLASITTQAALDTELSSRIESFTPYASVQAIKDVNPNLQKLGEWMDTHKNQLTLADVEAKTTGVNALASGDEETIWDNIYYQAITNESEARRDLCIQILRANKFLTAYTDMGQVSDEFSNAQKDLLESACNAYVVIPERLVVREKLDLTNLNNHVSSS